MRFWLVTAAVLVIPLVFTGSMYVALRHKEAHRFNDCLGKLPLGNLRDPGVGFIMEDLKGTGLYDKALWNINKPYRSDAYNILVPSGDVANWPEACSVPRDVPDCLASPQNRYIICNPEMGQQFSSRLLHSGAASIETDAAMRFVLLTFIGHELGHIAMSHSFRANHLVPGFEEKGMSCVHHPTDQPSEEEKADNYGIDLACASVRRRLSMENVPTDAAEGVRLVSRVQDQLDDNYFLRDDACVGDVAYPSIGRRKHTFSVRYLQCLYQNQWNPSEIMEEGDAKSFASLEQWLEKRQKSGQVASGSFGKESLYAHTVTALPFPDSYLTFDSTGLDSTLWLIEPNGHGKLLTKSLASWKSVGRVVNSEQTPEGRRFSVALSHDPSSDNGVLFQVTASCPGGGPSCIEPRFSSKIPIPEGFLSIGGEDGSLAMISKSSVERPDLSEGSPTPSAIPHRLTLTSTDDAAAAVTQDEILILKRDGGGAHDLSLVRGNAVSRRLLLLPPAERERLEAVAVRDGRLLLSSSVNPQTGDNSLYLFDCPAAIVERSANSLVDDCVRYRAPEDIEHAVAMATRDLSSLFDLSIHFPGNCGELLAVQHRGWLWVIDRRNGLQDLLPADGIVDCDLAAGEVTTFRARRIDHLKLAMQAVSRDKQSVLSLPVTF